MRCQLAASASGFTAQFTATKSTPVSRAEEPAFLTLCQQSEGGFPRPHVLSSRRKKRNKPNYECNTGRDDFDIQKAAKAKPIRLMPSSGSESPSGIVKLTGAVLST